MTVQIRLVRELVTLKIGGLYNILQNAAYVTVQVCYIQSSVIDGLYDGNPARSFSRSLFT